jgi:hypothetical protein
VPGRRLALLALALPVAVAVGLAAAPGVPNRLGILATRSLVKVASHVPDGLWALYPDAPAPRMPPPTTEPDGPIVVITAAENPFTAYLAEILRAEGLNELSILDRTALTTGALAGRAVVVLGELALDPTEVAALGAWTEAGGTLIAMRPDRLLAALLGLGPVEGTLGDGYLRVDTSAGPGRGIVGETMQFHGTADRWRITPGSATSVLATLYTDADTPTDFPAVTRRAVGSRGGSAVGFAYDLARSVVYTRQGNPAWAGEKHHGDPPRRSVDLYVGGAGSDPANGWIDFAKLAIPQADEQQRLLANVILASTMLPRFWYLPGGRSAAVVMTGDDHDDAGIRPRFDQYDAASPPGCSVDDWECVRATGYLYVGTHFTAADAERYTRRGFEVALHVNTDCTDWNPRSLGFLLDVQRRQFAAALPGVPAPVTSRTHCAAWSDWSTAAEIEAARGVRLDANYYFYPASWAGGRAGWFTGSGFPMHFATQDGHTIDCYQAATQITDESGMALPQVADALLDRALGPEGYYGVITANLHFDAPTHPGSDAIVASARARDVPVVSARQLLEWLDGRNASSFGAVRWDGRTLAFTVNVGAGARNLTGMVPLPPGAGSLLALTRDGAPLAYGVRTVKGMPYAFFAAAPGSYVAVTR